MFTEDCLKYVDVCLLCELLEIEVEELLAQFPDKVDEHMEELKELFDVDEEEEDEQLD